MFSAATLVVAAGHLPCDGPRLGHRLRHLRGLAVHRARSGRLDGRSTVGRERLLSRWRPHRRERPLRRHLWAAPRVPCGGCPGGCGIAAGGAGRRHADAGRRPSCARHRCRRGPAVGADRQAVARCRCLPGPRLGRGRGGVVYHSADGGATWGLQTVAAGGTSKYKLKVKLPKAGKWYMQSSCSEAAHRPSVSAKRSFTVR